VADYQPGDRLKEHKYLSFCQSSKRCKKKWGSIHQQTQLTIVCVVVVVFHGNFSSADGKDQHILPTFRQVGPSCRLPDIMTFVALALQMGHALKNTQYTTTGRDSDSYTICFTARP